MIATPASSKRFAHSGLEAMKTGMLLTKATPASSAHFGVEFGRLLAADRQVVHQHVGARTLQFGDDLFLGRLRVVGDHEGAIVLILAHMVGDAVQLLAHLHDRAGVAHVRCEHRGAVRLGEDRLRHVLADLATIDVPGRDDLDVARLVAAHVEMHQADLVVSPLAIMLETLHERAGAVADADDGDADRTHE